ncbi:MAG: YfcC family protein [Flavobacteriaceae bacterium]|nr:YfcC family protein [Flavobacteriaceae bacterium]
MKLKFPTPYTVLFIVVIISAIATWLVPSGEYQKLQYDKLNDNFLVQSKDGNVVVEATQETLNQYHIPITIDKFKEGKIKKPVSIPGTYKELPKNPQGIIDIILAPIKGMYEVIDIILFVLVIGGFIGIFNSTGTFDEGISYLSYQLKGKENWLIILVTTFIALGGTTFGMAEETLAFYPILVPVFLLAGYDLLVPLAVIYIGSNLGGMASTVNPFSVIIASDSAGVDWTVGLWSRIAMLIFGLVLSIFYIIRYGNKVKADPRKSLLFGSAITSHFDVSVKEFKTISLKSKLFLTLFAATFVIMIMGVSLYNWWFQEMTALFLVVSILMGLLMRIGEQEFVTSFIAGAKDLLGVSFIIGIARGVNFILNDGQISDSILYYATFMVDGMPSFVFLPSLMGVFAVLTLFISSSSGLAVVTMPIMSSLSTVIGVPPEEIVNAYLFGFGMMSFITPTGLILPSLAMVNINYNIWLKFIWPLLVGLAILSTLILWIGVLL